MHSKSDLRHPAVFSTSCAPDATIRHFLETYYASEKVHKFSLYSTGGGSSAISWLFSIPGASKSVLQASVPYAKVALQKTIAEQTFDPDEVWLGGFCTEETANKMAVSALKSSVEMILADTKDLRIFGEINLVGIGCTASLMTKEPKRGDHRCFVSCAKAVSKIACSQIVLTKGARSREDEDSLCSMMIMDALRSSADFEIDSESSFVSQMLIDNERVDETIQSESKDILNEIRDKHLKMCVFIPKVTTMAATSGDTVDISDFVCYENIEFPPGTLIYPGSFNPLHMGHVELVVASIKALGFTLESHPPVVFELSAVNADKPSLEQGEIMKRIKQFHVRSNSLLSEAGVTNYCVCVTSEPLFLAKSDIFRNCRFIVGVDTLTRLINKKYYENNAYSMMNALSVMNDRGCSFVVGGRVPQNDNEISFETLDDVLRRFDETCDGERSDFDKAISTIIKVMCVGISELDFRLDISSTELRSSMK